MANPFLVLGGVAVGVITAGIGVLQVPGWIASAQDGSAMNDIANVTVTQEAARTLSGGYVASVAGLDTVEGVKFTPSDGVKLYVDANDA